MADGKKNRTVEVQVLVTVCIDPTDGELQERINDADGTFSAADVVRGEIGSNLESMSYVEHVAVKCDPNNEEGAMNVRILPSGSDGVVGKLADCELHFSDGPLEGLKLVGFAVWERRRQGDLSVTFPARQYSVNGERRGFMLLRSILDASAQDRLRELILDAYKESETQATG